ncbi:MAG: acetyl-coenzyme A synthetase, partial [Candidatus Nitrosopolaris sp.]
AVTSRPDEKKGESIIGFVVLRTEFVSVSDQQLRNELVNHVRDRVGPIATPEEIYFVNKLPKTRSGKIMRRLLKSISSGSSTSIGDVSTLEDGTSLEEVRQVYDDLHKSIG